MPPQLAINGIDLSGYLALDDGWRRLPDIEIGGRDRAFGGGARNAVRAKKRAVQLRTVPRTQAEAEALRGLLQGEGDSWSFLTDVYSARGRGVTASAGTYIRQNVAESRPTYLLSDTPGTYIEWGNVLPSGSPWTLMCWRADGEFASNAWRHWFVDSTGVNEVNGVASTVVAGVTIQGGTALRVWSRQALEGAPALLRSTAYSVGARAYLTITGSRLVLVECTVAGTTAASAPSYVDTAGTAVGDGTATFVTKGRAGIFADDIVVLPFLVPSTWRLHLRTEMMSRDWTGQPRLRVTGDLVPNAPWTMDGKFDGSRNVPIASGTGLSVTHEALDFTLEES